MACKYFWIKERHNSQLGVYYVAYGNTLSVKDANAMESGSLYGDNYMHRFDTEEDYKKELERLRCAGKRIR